MTRVRERVCIHKWGHAAPIPCLQLDGRPGIVLTSSQGQGQPKKVTAWPSQDLNTYPSGKEPMWCEATMGPIPDGYRVTQTVVVPAQRLMMSQVRTGGAGAGGLAAGQLEG